MHNPFETIDARLSNIETLLLDIKHRPLKSKPSEQPSEQFLNVKEAAEFLSLTVPTVYTKVHRRELPFMKRGGRLYFSSTELMQYLKEGRRMTNAEIEQAAEKYLSKK